MFGAFLPLQLAFTVLPCDSYHKNLELVKEMGSKKAVLTGFIGGFTMLLIHLFYALAFWYGTTLVLNDDYTLGKVLTVSRCSLGQANFLLFKSKGFCVSNRYICLNKGVLQCHVRVIRFGTDVA